MYDIREKLIEILRSNPDIWMTDTVIEMIADHLIANGVIVVDPPEPQKSLCELWMGMHHGLPQSCMQLNKRADDLVYLPCSCDGDVDKCDRRRKR